jgi:hypothetical protein
MLAQLVRFYLLPFTSRVRSLMGIYTLRYAATVSPMRSMRSMRGACSFRSLTWQNSLRSTGYLCDRNGRGGS